MYLFKLVTIFFLIPSICFAQKLITRKELREQKAREQRLKLLEEQKNKKNEQARLDSSEAFNWDIIFNRTQRHYFLLIDLQTEKRIELGAKFILPSRMTTSFSFTKKEDFLLNNSIESYGANVLFGYTFNPMLWESIAIGLFGDLGYSTGTSMEFGYRYKENSPGLELYGLKVSEFSVGVATDVSLAIHKNFNLLARYRTSRNFINSNGEKSVKLQRNQQALTIGAAFNF